MPMFPIRASSAPLSRAGKDRDVARPHSPKCNEETQDV